MALTLEQSTAEQIGETEDDLKRLVVFFDAVAAEPSRFPLTGKHATSIRKLVRLTKGAAQPSPRKNKRKERQEKRQSWHKRRRQERKTYAEAYNAALAQIESEVAEAGD